MQQISTAKAATRTPPQGGQRDSVTVGLNLYIRARIAFKTNDWDCYSDQGSSDAHTQVCICAVTKYRWRCRASTWQPPHPACGFEGSSPRSPRHGWIRKKKSADVCFSPQFRQRSGIHVVLQPQSALRHHRHEMRGGGGGEGGSESVIHAGISECSDGSGTVFVIH